MPDVMTDRRAAPRYSLIVVAEVTEIASGARLNARTSDVSRTGCYVDTLHPTPAGSIIRLRLTHVGECFETQGKVVYVSPGLGMGVLFQDTAPEQLALLDRWLMVAAKNS
jgi:hypothetical protein